LIRADSGARDARVWSGGQEARFEQGVGKVGAGWGACAIVRDWVDLWDGLRASALWE